MVDLNIQMRKRNGNSWDNLFPITTSSNVFDTNGVSVTEQFIQTERELDNKKIDKNRGAVTSADLSQEVKEQMTGGSVAVVGENAVNTENIIDGSITSSKRRGTVAITSFDVSTDYISQVQNNNLYVSNKDLVTQSGFVSVEVFSSGSGSIKIFLIEEDNTDRIRIVEEFSSNVVPGVNFIQTDIIADGSGNEYVAVNGSSLTYTGPTRLPEFENNQTWVVPTSSHKVGDSFNVPDGKLKIFMNFNAYISDTYLLNGIKEETLKQLNPRESVALTDIDVTNYVNQANDHSLYISAKDLVTKAGVVSVELNSLGAGNVTVYLLREYQPDQFEVLSRYDTMVEEGVSFVYTDIIASGTGDEFVAVVGEKLAYTSSTRIPEIGTGLSWEVVGSSFNVGAKDLDVRGRLSVFIALNVYISDGGVVKALQKEVDRKVNILSNNIRTPSDIAREILFTPGSIIDLWGDSRTHGVGGTGFSTNGPTIPGTSVRTSPNSHSWANSFRDLMADRYDITVRNWGQSGTQAMQWVSQTNTLLNLDELPDLILIQFGTNERNRTRNEIFGYYSQLIDAIKAKGVEVILMTPPPVNPENDSETETYSIDLYEANKRISEIAYSYNMKNISNYNAVLKYCEYRDVPNTDLLADGLHDNDLGQDVIFRNICRELGISYINEGVNR